jgi:hypothetical protein
MKYLFILFIVFILLLTIYPAFAEDIDCYRSGKKEFHSHSLLILVSDQYIIVTHKHFDDIIVRKNKWNPQCFVTKLIH